MRYYGDEALGLVETIGLVPALEAADKMLKAADVELISYENKKYSGFYNVGPDDADCFQTGSLVNLFVKKWNTISKRPPIKWIDRCDGGPHEANFLKLDCSMLKTTFGWKPRWDLDTALEMVVEWSKCWMDSGDVRSCMDRQIDKFLTQ